MRAALGLFRATMWLAPPAFRRAYGRDAESAFAQLVEARRQAGGRPASVHIALMAIGDAARTALREWRRALGAGSINGAGGDFRYALRLFSRQPAHAAAVVLTLGVTIGALTAAFAFVDPILFKPLPYPDADRIVVAHAYAGSSTVNRLRAVDYARVRQASTTLEAVSSHYGIGFGEVAGDPTRSLAAVTPDFLRLTGVAPAIGRTFHPSEHSRTPAPVVLITDPVWRSTFGGRPDVVGQFLEAHLYGGRQRFEIIGVLPRGFAMPDQPRREQTAGLLPGDLTEGRGGGSLMPLIARLRPGVTIEQARDEVAAIVAEIDRTTTAERGPRVVALQPLRSFLFGEVTPVVRLIFLGAACVLLVGCANLAQLMMARLRSRRHDLAVRRALGASAPRLARMLVCEALALTASGALAAWIVARVALQALSRAVPYYEPAYRQLSFTVDARSAVFLIAVTVMAALLVQTWPIARAVRRGGKDLSSGARVSRRTRAEAAFVGAQAAIGMALVVCSLQVVSAFFTLQRQAGGFDPAGLQFISVTHSAGGPAPHTPEMHELLRRSFEPLHARFGASVAAFGGMPGAASAGEAARAGGAPPRKTGVLIRPASASAFSLLGVRLRRGRLYDEREAWTDAPVAVIDERGAELLWPGQDPIGKPVLTIGGAVREIIGLVDTLDVVAAPGALRSGNLFMPFSRAQQASFNVLFRSTDTGGTAQEAIQILRGVSPNVLARVNPYLPFEFALGPPRFAASVLGSLSLLALGLAAIGLFGMIAHAVVARRKEIAVRMALGARAQDVQAAIVGTHLAAGMIGLAAGAAIALRGTVLLQHVSAGVRPDDPLLFVMSAAVLCAVMLLASYLPTRRAARIDPAIALKAE